MFTYSNSLSEQELLEHAKRLEGLKLKDIGSVDEVDKWLTKKANKGAIGNVIQVCYFGIPANSLKEADFNHHNLELKVTPIKKNKNKTFSSKERLVLNIINYMTDSEYSFEKSPLLHKTKQMLLIFYLYEEDKDTREFKILKTIKFTIPKEDIPTIKEDYYTIINKIKSGQAHLISESDTTYLSACTKGAGKGQNQRSQPYSSVLAKQRAFSFKASYMTSYFKTVIGNNTQQKLEIPENLSLNDFISNTIQPYVGMTSLELEEALDYHPVKKSDADKGYFARLLKNLVQRIFNSEKIGLEKTQQFEKAQLKYKTIHLRENNSDNQDMSWPNINFHEIVEKEFEDSSWYEWFAVTKYLFVIFEDTPKGTILKSSIIWNAPLEMIESLEILYNHIKLMLLNKEVKVKIVKKSNGKEEWKNNLPSKDFVPFFQIRPKGTKKYPFTTLPDGSKFKKQCLFLNKEYLHSLL